MDVFQILVFLGFIILGIFQSVRQRQKKSRPGKIVRPVVSPNTFSMEDEVAEEVQPASVSEFRQKQEKYAAIQEKQLKPRVHVPLHPEKKESQADIRIRTSSDARKAFIYSEIFRRKYD